MYRLNKDSQRLCYALGSLRYGIRDIGRSLRYGIRDIGRSLRYGIRDIGARSLSSKRKSRGIQKRKYGGRVPVAKW